jgi:hypothetical protein
LDKEYSKTIINLLGPNFAYCGYIDKNDDNIDLCRCVVYNGICIKVLDHLDSSYVKDTTKDMKITITGSTMSFSCLKETADSRFEDNFNLIKTYA